MDVMNDDALVLVLERVDSHVSLIRAAAVCRRWRRAITDAAFLRRYRSHHAPAVAGYYHNHPSLWNAGERTGHAPLFFPTSPSRVDAGHFSLDFLPDGAASWCIWDSRGSLLVLFDDRQLKRSFPDHVICEPLTQRYRMVPLPPDSDSCNCLGPFLLDGEADETGGRISMSNFRLLCLFNCNGVTLTSVFTAGSSWSEKSTDPMAPSFTSSIWPSYILGRASGSWYFYIGDESGKLFDLNATTGAFSSSVLPAIEDWDFHIQTHNCVLTEGCDGKPRIIVVFNDTMKVFARLDSTEWALEKKIQLSEATCSLPGYPSSLLRHGISTVGVGFIILSQVSGEPWPFSVNLETMEAAPAEKKMGRRAYPCELSWPPALHACLD
ncbi:unnamed protein product [Urochloa decumbens]|uniref:F-box domain-containing protein n=1 Tax=Urochloa decumbens TaxID=240449 RepID=A0ABC8VI77_9POAL